MQRFLALQIVSFSLLFPPGFAVGADDSPSQPNAYQQVRVDPEMIALSGANSRFSLLVHGETKDGRQVDLTHATEYQSLASDVAEVTSTGLVRGVSDGRATILARVAGRTLKVEVTVRNATVARQPHFENDVIPIFNKFACNASGCHGKAGGQNGFKLSVFGFDPRADHSALTHEGRGRRVFPAVPERSLLLLKVAGGMPHGGGIRIRRNSAAYRTLLNWIDAGMPMGAPSAPRVATLRVTPRERQLDMQGRQQLRVVATYTDGRQEDVTYHAKYQSNSEALAVVDEFGRITAGDTPGEVAVMASYMGAVDVFRALIPRAGSIADSPKLPVHNFIDKLVDAKLAKLNIASSGLCTDAEYLRRVSLDTIGTLPTADEARAFLADKRPDRRARLVDQLLERSEFADYWALKWSDLLRVDRLALGHKGAYSYYSWIRKKLADNVPYDQFVRELISAEGRLADAPAGYLFKAVKKPGDMASTLSQVFLGIRIECAQCHHHPYDRWSQTDYFGMQAFFTQVSYKSSPDGELLAALGTAATKHPRSGEVIFAHPLGTSNPQTSPEGDRRKLLARWMTAPENPWLAQNLVNRVWAHYLGRGLVEPIDDVRSTNPPTNPALLQALADDFVKQGYDVHQLIRTITASRTYQLSSKPNESNEKDEQNYSRALFKRLDAEVLLDAVCQTTGIGEKFHGVPAGYRAIQLWDSQVSHYFLKLFGRPIRVTACDCERTSSVSVSQVLHILNSPEIHAKLSHERGRIAALAAKFPKDNGRLVEELYLSFYSRFPSAEERRATVGYLNKHTGRRRPAAEDIAWSMMNTVEFLFNH